MIPAIGHIVHFCLPAWAKNAGHERPAIITNIVLVPAAPQLADLTVFTAPDDSDLQTLSLGAEVQEGLGAGQWHAYADCPKRPEPVTTAPLSEEA